MTKFVLAQIQNGTKNYLSPNGKYLAYIRFADDEMSDKEILEFLNKNFTGRRAQILLYDRYHIKNLNPLKFGDRVLFEPTFATNYFKDYLKNNDCDIGYAYNQEKQKWLGIKVDGSLLDNDG